MSQLDLNRLNKIKHIKEEALKDKKAHQETIEKNKGAVKEKKK